MGISTHHGVITTYGRGLESSTCGSWKRGISSKRPIYIWGTRPFFGGGPIKTPGGYKGGGGKTHHLTESAVRWAMLLNTNSFPPWGDAVATEHTL